jgi:hypothetical protein
MTGCAEEKDSGSGSQISLDQNSLFHEVEIKFVHEVEFFH